MTRVKRHAAPVGFASACQLCFLAFHSWRHRSGKTGDLDFEVVVRTCLLTTSKPTEMRVQGRRSIALCGMGTCDVEKSSEATAGECHGDNIDFLWKAAYQILYFKHIHNWKRSDCVTVRRRRVFNPKPAKPHDGGGRACGRSNSIQWFVIDLKPGHDATLRARATCGLPIESFAGRGGCTEVRKTRL